MIRIIVPLLLIGSVGLSGCESSDGREPVTGTVTMGGQPLSGAVVLFEPTDPSAGSSGAAQTGADGTFKIDASQGLLPGDYLVKITKSEGGGEVDPDEMPGESSEVKLAKQIVPAKYNTKTELKETISSSSGNRFDFALDAK